MFDGRPVIGICNSWSELAPCNGHLRQLAEKVKIGVYQAGGFPVEFPTISLGETVMRPTTMLFRNLMSMDVEESIRANPLDGVVLLGSCDKTVPAQLMGMASVDLPALMLTGGPMLNGKYQGRDIGSGTDVWRLSEEVRAGRLEQAEFEAVEACMSRSQGHCMTMGTASSMACVAEALGIALPGSAAIPAADARRLALAELAGRRIVDAVNEDLRPSHILTRDAFENAIRLNTAIGGSTNTIVHLLALAGRLGIGLTLEDFDRLARDVPLLVNLMPSGDYLMEDFYYAGGVPGVMREIISLLHEEALTITGESVAENIGTAKVWNRSVIRSLTNPLKSPGTGIAVLHGTLAPSGAVIKQSSASPHLQQHTGSALVFDSIEEYNLAAEDPELDVDADSILIVRYAGPKGYPGMPEIANLALPRKMLEAGVKDMIRISDARMSGTSYGTVVLHVAPEAAVGGPLALVQSGDIVTLDVRGRRLDIHVDDEELLRRRGRWQAPEPQRERGYVRLYIDHVTQADKGADLDFLIGGSGDYIPRIAF